MTDVVDDCWIVVQRGILVVGILQVVALALAGGCLAPVSLSYQPHTHHHYTADTNAPSVEDVVVLEVDE
jgi:hypothetical protein